MSESGKRDLAGTSLIVTGGTGFLGSAFVRHAVAAGAEVTVVARPGADHWRLAGVAGGYQTRRGSLAELPASDTGERWSTMVHFAAAGVNQTFDDWEELIATNVSGTARAVMFARSHGIRRLVLLGTSGEYGTGQALSETAPLNPTSPYGATRAAATLLARSMAVRDGLELVVLRPFAVYGPFESRYRLIPYAIQRALAGQPIEITSGRQTRDYVHLDDVAHAVHLACTLDTAAHGVFNICTGMETSVRDVAELVARLCGTGSQVITGARPDIPGEMWRTSGNATRAREVLGWAPQISLADGLRRTIDWFRAVGARLPEYQRAPG